MRAKSVQFRASSRFSSDRNRFENLEYFKDLGSLGNIETFDKFDTRARYRNDIEEFAHLEQLDRKYCR